MAEALGYANTKDALINHVDKEDKRILQRSEIATIENHIPKDVFPVNFVSGDIPNRGLTIINESGLYALIFGGKLESAKKFKHWVTSEVLPSIRKTGSYSTVEYPIDAAILKGLAASGNLLRSTMKDEGVKPHEIAIVINALFGQSGVNLPECFVKKPEYEQLSLWNSVN